MPLNDRKVKKTTFTLPATTGQFYILINAAGDRALINAAGDKGKWK